jgi:DNA-binding XRE family transcriptional regulator
MRAEILHHKIANITIRPIEPGQAKALKRVIATALNEYLEETSIPASALHKETKARHGAYYKTPGYYLRVYRTRAGLTQKKLATRLDIRQHHLSEMEHNKRPIGKNIAKKLSEELGCDYHKFL